MEEVRAARRPGWAVHRGMVKLLGEQLRWLVDHLIDQGLIPHAEYGIQQLPTETWPVGEENRQRELRADLVLRLWPGGRVPDLPSIELIRRSHVIGIILDFQDRRDPDKPMRLIEYESAYPPVLAARTRVLLVVLTLRAAVARWMRREMAEMRLRIPHCVLTPRELPRGDPIDVRVEPRRALLEAMIQVHEERDLALLTNALRALRYIEGNELLIYREMLLSEMPRSWIMRAHEALETVDEYEQYRDYVPTRRERESFLYVHGLEAGLERGREEGREEGRAQTLLELLRIRGLVVDPASEARILACRDAARMSGWLARALAVARVEALFDDDGG
jgi:hypothetical protein